MKYNEKNVVYLVNNYLAIWFDAFVDATHYYSVDKDADYYTPIKVRMHCNLVTGLSEPAFRFGDEQF